jgi:hypothetical protein
LNHDGGSFSGGVVVGIFIPVDQQLHDDVAGARGR